MEHGWNEQAGAFTQAFGGENLDASNLMPVISGFLPGDDSRMKATIDATAERLTDGCDGVPSRGCYPARAGGPWLCSTLVLSLFHAVVVPSGSRTSIQPYRNPYWNRSGLTFLDPDGYRLVIAAGSMPHPDPEPQQRT